MKAFDTMDHSILLGILTKYGICGITLKSFKSYLSEHYQYVSLDTFFSSLKKIEIGVLQGSTLGPIHFKLYINDLPNIT